MHSIHLPGAALALSCLLTPSPLAAPIQGPSSSGPGFPATSFAPAQVGTVVAAIDSALLGNQPTIADLQHGWLYIASGGFGANGDPQHSWINLASPLAPTIEGTLPANGNKPHMLTFWDDFMINGGQGKPLWIYRALDDTPSGLLVGSVDTGVRPVHHGVQPPWDFRGTNGYVADPNQFAVTRFDDPVSPVLVDNTIDLGLPNYIGAAHIIGNLMITTATDGDRGVAVFDVSNPVAPVLLDNDSTSGEGIYLSAVYGHRIFTAEINNGIRIYEFDHGGNLTEVGFVPTGGNPRYVTLKEGVGYVAPANGTLVTFPSDQVGTAPGAVFPLDWNGSSVSSDFVFPMGNVAVLGGSSSHNFCGFFALDGSPDVQGPKVELASPANGAQDVALTARIGFSMSDHIDVTTLNTGSFQVRPACAPNAETVQGTYSVSHYGIINFAPDKDLLPHTTYEVLLPVGGMDDIVGNGLREGYIGSFTTGASEEPQPGGLSHRWPLNGNAHDIEGANDGAELNVTYAPAQVRDGGTFDGTARIDVGSLALGDRMTFSSWVWIDDGAGPSHTILANTNALQQTAQVGAFPDGFALSVRSAQGSQSYLLLQTGDGTNGRFGRSLAGYLGTDCWHHVSVTIDRANPGAQFFIDGVERTQRPFVQAGFDVTDNVWIGNSPGSSEALTGRLDEVQVHDDVLSADEVLAVMGLGNRAPQVLTLGTSSQPVETGAGNTVTFSMTYVDPDPDDVHSFTFDFGDGTPVSTAGPISIAHGYALPGRYTVIATVSDGLATASKTFVQVVHRPLTPLPPASSSTIAYNALDDTVWCVNPDNATVSVVDGAPGVDHLKQLTEIPVAANPRFLAVRPDGREVWVSCGESSSLVRIDALNRSVISTLSLPYGRNPAGIAFTPDGVSAFLVSEPGGIARFDAMTGLLTGSDTSVSLPMRGIAINHDASRIFVARFISPSLDPLSDPGWLGEFDPQTLQVNGLTLFPFDNTIDSEVGGSGAPNYLSGVVIAPDGRSARLPAKKDNTKGGLTRSGIALDHDNTVRSILMELNLVTGTPVTPYKDINDSGLSTAVAFSRYGDLVFQSFITNNKVMAFDTYTGSFVAMFDTGAAPDGLCIHPDGTRLFVHEFLGRAISSHNIAWLLTGESPPSELAVTTGVVGTELLAADVLHGKQLFYDASNPKMALEGYMSCASCHLNGDQDARVWDFSHRPDGGVRNTIDLRGRSGTGHGNVHWSANFDEIQDFEHDIRDAFGGTGFIVSPGTLHPPLGGPTNAGESDDLDDLAAYVTSLAEAPRSPNRNPNGTFTAQALAGWSSFQAAGCASCHSLPNLTDNLLHDVGTSDITGPSGLRGVDTPTLFGVWSGAPYLHTGAAQTLEDVFSVANAPAMSNAHDAFRDLTPQQQDDLIRFLSEL